MKAFKLQKKQEGLTDSSKSEVDEDEYQNEI
jgi:hypothetical protein